MQKEKEVSARVVPSAEDILEMSGVETLHPGGFELTRRVGDAAGLEGARVLDVSSGKGVSACFWAEAFGTHVTGVEIREDFLAMARKRAADMGVSDRVHFEHGDSRALPFPDDSFDVVVNECAVGLTAIDAPRRVLDEMVRVTKPGGKVVIHESTWLTELPAGEKSWLAARLGTVPQSGSGWQRMLISAGATPELVEDWSGTENLMMERPDRKWDPARPASLFTWQETLTLIPKVISRYGLGAVVDLYRSMDKLAAYYGQGSLGYTLIVARKDGTAKRGTPSPDQREDSHE